MISPNFNSKAIALISSMIITIARSKVTTLQVALGLLLQEKKLIEHLYEYGVTASYDEVRRFKISAAYSASQEKEKTLDSKRRTHSRGIRQLWCKSFNSKWIEANSFTCNHCHSTLTNTKWSKERFHNKAKEGRTSICPSERCWYENLLRWEETPNAKVLCIVWCATIESVVWIIYDYKYE